MYLGSLSWTAMFGGQSPDACCLQKHDLEAWRESLWVYELDSLLPTVKESGAVPLSLGKNVVGTLQNRLGRKGFANLCISVAHHFAFA